ncbi:MAG: Gfo/Idh/MocA family oxidoreductase [Planctomycetaceae bacterium]|nr:Gfo/Idh/MocA family oxidoreductase [Planctomycetaceae bacterium]
MYRVAILGTGGISDSHIQGFLQFPERCRIVALADRFPDVAKKQAAKYSLDCRIAADPVQFAGDDDIDLVAICTPPATHESLAIAYLNAGKNVLLEKPMAASLEECDRVLAAAQASGTLLSIVAQNRFRTPAWRLKKVVDSGILGDIRHVQVLSHWWRTPVYYDTDWRGTWSGEGGGCTYIHSVHQIDQTLWLVGMPYEIVSVVDNLAHSNSEVEDISISVFRCRPHIVGQLTSSLVYHGEEQSITIQAERASVAMPWRAVASKPATPDTGFPGGQDEAFLRELEAFYQSIPALRHEGHAGQIDDVLTALEEDRPPLITGRDGYNAMNVIQGIYKSAFGRASVALPLAPGDDYYTQKGLLDHAVRFHDKPKSSASLS